MPTNCASCGVRRAALEPQYSLSRHIYHDRVIARAGVLVGFVLGILVAQVDLVGFCAALVAETIAFVTQVSGAWCGGDGSGRLHRVNGRKARLTYVLRCIRCNLLLKLPEVGFGIVAWRAWGVWGGDDPPHGDC